MPVWMVLSFADLFDSEVGCDAIGEGGVGGARGISRALVASAVNVGKGFRRGRDEVDESYDGGGGTSIFKIVTSLLDHTDPSDDVDELVSYGRQ